MGWDGDSVIWPNLFDEEVISNFIMKINRDIYRQISEFYFFHQKNVESTRQATFWYIHRFSQWYFVLTHFFMLKYLLKTFWFCFWDKFLYERDLIGLGSLVRTCSGVSPLPHCVVALDPAGAPLFLPTWDFLTLLVCTGCCYNCSAVGVLLDLT